MHAIWEAEARFDNFRVTTVDTRTQGYWHRQCLGVAAADGGIDPGRNGRGPQEPTEPVFAKDLMPVVSLQIEALFFEMGGACAGGMDADPASDPCERAIKQSTALLFNRASDRLQDACSVDLSAYGCESTDIGSLVGEIAGLINSGDPLSCQVASDCAGAVNEGEALTEAAPFEPAAGQDPTAGTATARSASAASGGRGRTVSEAGVFAGAEPATTVPEPNSLVVMSAEEKVEAADDGAAEEEELTAIRLQLAVMTAATVPDRVRAAARDALLTVLSGGHDVELRLEIARTLVSRVDPAFDALLAAHLEDIRSEARDFGHEDVAREAGRLLQRLQTE